MENPPDECSSLNAKTVDSWIGGGGGAGAWNWALWFFFITERVKDQVSTRDANANAGH